MSIRPSSQKDSWRDAILNDFVPNVSKLTLVADPDSLLILLCHISPPLRRQDSVAACRRRCRS